MAGLKYASDRLMLGGLIALMLFPALSSGTALKAPSITDTLSRSTLGSPWPGGGVSAVALSPNKKFIAYLVRDTDWIHNAFITRVWVANLVSGKETQLTTGQDSASILRWSPDGARIAFVSQSVAPSSDAAFEIKTMRPDGEDLRRITEPLANIPDFKWSADGTSIFFIAARPQPSAITKRELFYGDLHVVGRDYRQMTLWTVSSSEGVAAQPAGTAEQLLSNWNLNIETFAVSPDGKYIAMSAAPDALHPDHPIERLFLLTLGLNKRPRLIVALSGSDTSPAFSPDSKYLAFVSTLYNKNAFYANEHIAVVNMAAILRRSAVNVSEVRDLTPTFEQVSAPIEWRGAKVFFTAGQPNSAHLFCLDPASLRIRQVSRGPNVIVDDADASSDGSSVAYIAEDDRHVKELYVSRAASWNAEKVTNETARFENWRLGSVSVVSWRSKDGTVIDGILHKPIGFSTKKRYPLVVLTHGGPSDEESLPAFFPDDFAYPIESFLAEDVVVLEPNYRGSDGFGGRFRALNVRNLGVGDMWDVMSGVDNLISAGVVDPARMVAMGWSEGGFISAYLVTHTTRFKAASVGAGVSDWSTLYSQSDIPAFMLQYFKATPWANPSIYQRSSPIAAIRNARTPTLIQAGSVDQRVATAQGYELYRGLVDMHVETRFILYAGMHHWDPTPKTQRAIEQANLDWFNRYIFKKGLLRASPILGEADL